MIRSFLKACWRKAFGDARWRVVQLERKVDALSAAIDVRKVPRAAGPLRVIQLASLSVLKEITDLLDAHGIAYSLCGGTLLGAIRHQGFIPWDDDIDMAVLREDYERVKSLLSTRFDEKSGFRVVTSTCIRVILDRTPCQVDIFPFETHFVTADTSACRMAFSRRRDAAMKRIVTDWSRLKSDGFVIANPEVIPEVIRELRAADDGEHRILLTGCETANYHYPPLRYDWVFPLARGDFEGLSFSIPGRPDVVLLNYYGDYMKLPSSAQEHEDIRARLTVEAYELMLARLAAWRDRIGEAAGVLPEVR